MSNTTRILRRAQLGALALALLTVAGQANADRYVSPSWRNSQSHPSVDGNLIDVQVRVEGRTAPLYFRPGTWDRNYFEAFKGRNYSLVLRNQTGRRVGVLVSVDGLNVVNGEKSSLDRNEPMYVLDPYEQATIQGWRTSLDEVRRFVFVNEERSYAERTGQANGDMGWIRVLSFREIEPVGWWDRISPRYKDRDEYHQRRESSSLDREGSANDQAPQAPKPSREMADRRDAAPAPESRGYANEQESNPGTGWGRRDHDPVRQTQFEPERSASDHIIMRYEYAAGLRALGIFPRRNRLWDREDGNLGFAQPPRW